LGMLKEQMIKQMKFVTGNVETWVGDQTFITEKLGKGTAVAVLAIAVVKIPEDGDFEKIARRLVDENLQ